MNGQRGGGTGWLVIIIFLVVVAGLVVLGAVTRNERDAAEQTVTDARTPTADVFEPPKGNTDDGDDAPGTPGRPSAGADTSVTQDVRRLAGASRYGAAPG
jgi:hypothetical protein